jgi:hypothetical protein
MTQQINPADAVDLAKLNDAAAVAEKKLREQEALQNAMEYAGRWDRAMTRAFKGIRAAPKRRADMMKATDRLSS